MDLTKFGDQFQNALNARSANAIGARDPMLFHCQDACTRQYSKMLRRAGLAEMQLCGDFVNGLLPGTKQFDDPKSTRVGERAEKLTGSLTDEIIHGGPPVGRIILIHLNILL